MPIDTDDLADISFTARESIRQSGTYDIVVSDRTREEGSDDLGAYMGLESWRIGTIYPIRNDTGEVYKAVYVVEGDWTSGAVESILPELASSIPYLIEVPITVYDGKSRTGYRVGTETIVPINPDRPQLDTYKNGELHEIAISVNRGTSLEHYIRCVTADTTIKTVQEWVDAEGIDPVVLRRISVGEYQVVEPKNDAQLGDLFMSAVDRQMLVFHPGRYEEIVGNPFEAHPAFQPLNEQ